MVDLTVITANKAVVRMYNDLWQLKIDMPGGNWDPKDLERDEDDG